jgi:murein DD-endopeptidase MepM/ murein hydrolase activator NlpD
LIGLALLSACAHRGHGAPGSGRSVQTVKVAEGDTLYSLARKAGVTPEALSRANGIGDPTALAIGRELVVPAPQPPAQAGASSSPHPGRLLWPVRGVIYSPYGPRGSEHHDGLDLAAPEGTPIVAADEGTVLFVGEQRGYGRLILVAHKGDLVTVYAHNRENLVKSGEKVARGQQLATVGTSGRASGPHVHFEVRQGTRPRNPIQYLR